MRTEINLGDPVCDFAFESRENLKMAGLVSKTWPKIRDNAARYFLVALRSIVLKGAGIEVLWRQLVALVIYATFMLLMASRRLKKSWA